MGKLTSKIDPQQISFTSRRLGFQSGRPQTAPRNQISRLEYRKAGSEDGGSEPQLAVWAGSQKYELRSHPPLTTPELDWLAYELSAWLKLPLS